MRRSVALVVVAVVGMVGMDASSAEPPVHRGGKVLRTTLSGAEEVNSAGVPNQGDPDGSGAAELTLRVAQGELCYTVTVDSIALPVTASHIHVAPAGSAGPVVVALGGSATNLYSGCVAVDPELLRDIKRNPTAYYVNVHNSEYPAGAVRGQLGD